MTYEPRTEHQEVKNMGAYSIFVRLFTGLFLGSAVTLFVLVVIMSIYVLVTGGDLPNTAHISVAILVGIGGVLAVLAVAVDLILSCISEQTARIEEAISKITTPGE